MHLACLQPVAHGVADLVRCVLVPSHAMARSQHFSDSEYHNLWGSLQAGENHVCTRQARGGAGGRAAGKFSGAARRPGSLRRPAHGRKTGSRRIPGLTHCWRCPTHLQCEFKQVLGNLWYCCSSGQAHVCDQNCSQVRPPAARRPLTFRPLGPQAALPAGPAHAAGAWLALC